MKVLITGGSGYLGQILVSHLSPKYEVRCCLQSTASQLLKQVSYTYLGANISDEARSYKVDFESGEGLHECLTQVQDIDVVVNCAAISQTRICQEEKERAIKVNIPTGLLTQLLEACPDKAKQPLFIHLSSDQVYDGSKAFWLETDECQPVNYYGVTKVEAEKLIQSQWSNFVILRSSLIYGPACKNPPIPSRFLDFITKALCSEQGGQFFSDEYRCPVYVKDIAQVIEHFISKSKNQRYSEVLNMGGPDRLNRVQMAQKVAQCLAMDLDRVKATESAKLNRTVPSPLDISMISEKLTKELGWSLTSFSNALCEIYQR